MAQPGALGLVICVGAFSGVLFFAAMANSAMASYRQLATPDRYQSRVTSRRAFGAVVAQPPFALIAGVIA